MDTVYLQTFIDVVDAGSIAEAARRRDLAPTTVAQQIRALEIDLGSRLLTRAGRTVRPTVAGRRVLARARLVIRTVHDLRSDASDTALPAGPLRLGATPTGLMGILPPVLRRWRQQHADVAIHIEPGTSTRLQQQVLDNDLDAAVLVHPAWPLPKTCAWQPLRHERLILLTPARMKVDDPLQTLAREPFIRYDRGVVAGRMADDYVKQLGLKLHAQFELDGIEHIAKLVAEGLGVSILPDWATIGRADPSVRRWPLPEPCPQRVVGLLWLRGAVRAPLAEALAALFDD